MGDLGERETEKYFGICHFERLEEEVGNAIPVVVVISWFSGDKVRR